MPTSLQKVHQSRLPVVGGGMLCALVYCYLAMASDGYGGASLAQMLWVCGLAGLVTFALFFWSSRAEHQLRWSDILFFAILFRLIGVLAFPVLEDDFYRYLWDGWQTHTFGSPYGSAPADFFSDDSLPDRWSEVLDGVNYPAVATVYGPTAQWLFAAGFLVAPGEVWPLQCLAALADIGIVLLLQRLAPLRWVLLYAWCPLVIKEFAFTAHVDVIGALCVLGALTLRVGQRSDQHATAVSLSVGLLLALACGVKIFALLAVPFLLQNDWRGWLAWLAGMALLAWPFGLVDAWLPGGLQAMGDLWLFNAPIYFAATGIWGPSILGAAKWICLVGFGLAAAWVFLSACGRALWPLARGLRARRPLVTVDTYLTGMTFLFGLFLLALPVLNPWYLVWWLVLSVLRPSITAWVCSVTLFLSYCTGINLGAIDLQLYQQPTWVLWFEFVPVLVALGFDLVRHRQPWSQPAA